MRARPQSDERGIALAVAIFALVVFFVVGGALLLRVDTRRGIREAGNDVPAVL